MSSSTVTAYPLCWPSSVPRTPAARRRKAQFVGTVDTGRRRLQLQLGMVGASGVIISTNLSLRGDGLPRATQAAPEDPGVAVYFQLRLASTAPRHVVMAVDRFGMVAENMIAIAKSLDAIRGLERWGGARMVSAVFSGFGALPPPASGSVPTPDVPASIFDAARVVGSIIAPDFRDVAAANLLAGNLVSLESILKTAIMKLHPDANGGLEHPQWNALMRAADILRKHFRP